MYIITHAYKHTNKHTHTHTHIYIYIYIYIYISNCVETVYELLLLPNNSASERFSIKFGRCAIN